MIDQQKATEYKQVAALLCLDIDMLYEIMESRASCGEIAWHIRDLKDKKDKMLSDKREREMRYSAAEAVFGAAMRSESSEVENG